MPNTYEENMLTILAEIHNRLGEISKFLEICTAKFAHIDAHEMYYIKDDSPVIYDDSDDSPCYSLCSPPENHCVGFDKHYGLHFMATGYSELQALAWRDHNREVPIDKHGNFVKETKEVCNNAHNDN